MALFTIASDESCFHDHLGGVPRYGIQPGRLRYAGIMIVATIGAPA